MNNPIASEPQILAPHLVRLIAPNPSPMTYWGTNSYILGQKRLTIIDPGPDNPAHLAALIKVIANRPVDRIVVTHSHLDHSPLAGPLAKTTGAAILAYGDSKSGQSPIMRAMAENAALEGGEGVDRDFSPDECLSDGCVMDWGEGPITVTHTPGHMGNHICLRWRDAFFSGDHIMGWASSLVSPPDGDLTDFMKSCHKLLAQPNATFYPGHGDIIRNGHARVAELIAHRTTRECQILQALIAPMTASQIAEAIYVDTPAALIPAATRNVLAHLIDLVGRNKVQPNDALTAHAKFHIVSHAI